MKSKRCTSGQVLRFCFFGWLVGGFVFVFGGEDERNRMVAIVGQIEQGKFLVVILAGKCLYFLWE